MNELIKTNFEISMQDCEEISGEPSTTRRVTALTVTDSYVTTLPYVSTAWIIYLYDLPELIHYLISWWGQCNFNIQGWRDISIILLVVVGDGWKDKDIYIYIYNMCLNLIVFPEK